MRYRSLRECVLDLERAGHLVRLSIPVDPHLEMAEIQRRVHRAGGPAVLFENVKGSPFPAVSNLFGTLDRCRYIFRSTLDRARRIIELKADPASILRSPGSLFTAPWTALRSLPRRVRSGPVLHGTTRLDLLPAIQSWPDDGGPFVTLPQVLTEDPDRRGPLRSNVGMYRIQLAGNSYRPNEQAGLHFQIHRGIGPHYARARDRGEPLRVSVFVGGPPAHTLAAVMPLPEGLSELLFAGMLAGRRFRYCYRDDHFISADADFCLVGRAIPGETLPEGPFGDHLGYYSLKHDFPVLEVEAVYHRRDAIWPFTVVGRPPQEDTSFGALIHELTGPMVPVELPGLHELHAVDAAGVHPLLLAIGSERYVPFGERVPQEILTIANSILGFGQASLAKYLLIVAREDDAELTTHDLEGFLVHLLERIDLSRDLHFQTRTTMDTLDYSGTGLKEGSKVVMAAAGEKRRELARSLPSELRLPDGFSGPRLPLPGVLVLQGAPYTDAESAAAEIEPLTTELARSPHREALPLVVLADDAEFTGRSLENFLWVTFTRSNPSHDIHGGESTVEQKHWGCLGPLLIDARRKPHHAPPLVEDPEVTRRVDELAAAGKPLHGLV